MGENNDLWIDVEGKDKLRDYNTLLSIPLHVASPNEDAATTVHLLEATKTQLDKFVRLVGILITLLSASMSSVLFFFDASGSGTEEEDLRNVLMLTRPECRVIVIHNWYSRGGVCLYRTLLRNWTEHCNGLTTPDQLEEITEDRVTFFRETKYLKGNKVIVDRFLLGHEDSFRKQNSRVFALIKQQLTQSQMSCPSLTEAFRKSTALLRQLWVALLLIAKASSRNDWSVVTTTMEKLENKLFPPERRCESCDINYATAVKFCNGCGQKF